MRLSHAIVGSLLTGAILAACSFGELNQPPPDLDGADVPNVAAMSDKVMAVFKAVKLAGYPRVSRVRRAPVTAIADWIVCLRGDSDNDPHIYALLIQNNEIVDYRLALLIDQCANETYGPLPSPMPFK